MFMHAIIIFFSSLFPLLLNIKMKIKNHSNLTILSTFKYKNKSHQIHSYSIKNKNKKQNKIFILSFLIARFHVPNMTLVFSKKAWKPSEVHMVEW